MMSLAKNVVTANNNWPKVFKLALELASKTLLICN